MPITTDKLELISRNKSKHRHHELICPEGLLLDLYLANIKERISAFILDILFIYGVMIVLFIIFFVTILNSLNFSYTYTFFSFSVFIVQNFYFIYFELAWQGRTPGKKVYDLRVINRKGGELTPTAIIARNLTRQVEIFIPLSLFFQTLFSYSTNFSGEISPLIFLAWLLIISALPLFNRENLRAGDIIGGTFVIVMPKNLLKEDLSSLKIVRKVYKFTPEQLSIYGAYELQVLEEILRTTKKGQILKSLRTICDNIRKRIGWTETIPKEEILDFLSDFYTAERAELERNQLFGKLKADKMASPKIKTG